MNEREKLIKIEMIVYGDNYNSLAKFLGISRQTVVRKVKEGSFSQEEMSKIKMRYNMSDEKFVQIFTEGMITNEG